ncbi:MAG TPA: DEAD/DEAH box helicase [Bacteroidia bacterium]|jgi:ATP-independent RNA helicase DbpA|nr:DEAD/DEAH box helicase [Bacteroidia bacterium]HRG53266.1 DEAD/DEAH box helicase [Bacteroidia bacterium]
MITTQKILHNLKITALNKMQEAVVEASSKKEDVVLLSPTGSGKTLAFLLTVLQHVQEEKDGIQALIVVPSRELGLQIEQVFKQMKTGLKVNCCYGGHSTKIEKQNLEHAPAVLIGTPGRLAFHIRNEYVHTATIKLIVLDEFDKALEFGFKEDMSFIIGSLTNLKTRMLTSATNLTDLPDFTGIKKYSTLNFLEKNNKSVTLQLKTVQAENADKLDVFVNLIGKLGHSSSIVFCNHREAVGRISDLLKSKSVEHAIFHGGLEQDEREKTLIKFRNGSTRLLITTDLASRGLDIPEIENVIHYQLPATEDVFIHRNGRTARMQASGTAYLLLGEKEYVPAFIKEKAIAETIPAKQKLPENPIWCTVYVAAGKKDKINKMDIVGLFLQKGKLEKDELGLIEVLDHAAYVAVKRNRVEGLLKSIKSEKIKNKSVKIGLST